MKGINHDDSMIEIDFLAFFKILKAEKTIIGLSVFLATILGGLYAFVFNTKAEFVAIGKIMPEVASKPTNGMGGLFEILKKYSGNVDMYNTEITRPDIYDEIINTKAFCNYLLSKNVETISSKKLNFKTYYDANLILKNSFYQQEKQDSASNNRAIEYAYQQDIQKRIVITTSKKNNLVSVSVKMPDPVVAANIANYTIDYLIDFITKYRTEKARQELFFVEKLLKNTQQENFSKEIHKSLMAFELQMKIKIQEDTPILQVLEYAQIPVMNSNPSIFSIILPCLFIGLIVGIIVALFKNKSYRMLFR